MSISRLTFILLFLSFTPTVFCIDKAHVDSLERVIATTTNQTIKADALLKLSAIYDFDKPQLALKYATDAAHVSKENSDYINQCGALLRMAKIYYVQSDLKNGMECAINAKDIAVQHNLKLQEAIANDAVGMFYYEIGDESKSSDCFFSSLKAYEDVKDRVGIGKSLCRIGTLYYNQKEYQKAKDYYIRSIELAKQLDDKEGISSNLNNLATVYMSEENYSKALDNFKEALAINKDLDNLQLIGSNYLNIGNLFIKMGNYPEAMVNCKEALRLFQEIGNQVRIAKTQLAISEIHLAMKQYNEAILSVQPALDTAMMHGFKEIIANAAGILQQSYLGKNDSLKAYRYTLLANQWRDSLAFGERQKKLARLELQYNFEKREQELRLEKQRRNFFIIILVAGIAFSIVIILLLLNRYQLSIKKSALEKENLEKDLEYKKKELTLNVMSLMKKNEMLQEITRKILKIEKESEQEETRKALKRVAKELQKSTDEEILKEFSMRFKEVHNDFYDKLLKQYPQLTPSELKLCAFLRLNMTSKEIAELTGQQIATLENARYRLRQKLGITSSDVNLVTFLAQI